MMSFYTVFAVLLILNSVHSWHSEDNWATIYNGRPRDRFDPVIFQNHPKKAGQKVSQSYAALYIDNSRELTVFGQATMRNDGLICAEFNLDDQVHSTCDRYRILINSPRNEPFTLLKPERFNAREYKKVEYINQQLVLLWDPIEQDSYFGTLSHRPGEESFAYSVDYNGNPIRVHGKDAVSGKFLLYIVEQIRN